jgi:hypothetical protein
MEYKNMKEPYIKRTYRISKFHAKEVKRWAKKLKVSESEYIRRLILEGEVLSKLEQQ